MKFQSHVKVGARFQAQLYKADGSVKQSALFCNLVLNQGLDLMGTETYFGGIAVGTGNSDPVVSQVDLDARIARSTTSQGSISVVYTAEPVPKYTLTRTFRFNAGTLNNVNLSEVCIISSSSPYKAFNRALIRDASGNPTTITVLSDEYLDVTGFLDFYPEMTDVTQVINLVDGNNVPINPMTLTIRPAYVGNASYPPRDPGQSAASIYGAVQLLSGQNNQTQLYSGDIGAITEKPAGTALASIDYNSTANVQGIQDAYVAGSYKRTGRLIVKLNAGNGTIKSLFCITSLHSYQVQFDPPIVKKNTQILTIPMEISWGRYDAT